MKFNGVRICAVNGRAQRNIDEQRLGANCIVHTSCREFAEGIWHAFHPGLGHNVATLQKYCHAMHAGRR